MTSLRRDYGTPPIEESEDGIHVTLHLSKVPPPVGYWRTAFNEIAGDSGCEAMFQDDETVLVLTLPLNIDQSATDAKLDHVEKLIANADEQFKESNASWITSRSQVEDWWTRRIAKDLTA